MGYYIETDGTHNKAQELVDKRGAHRVLNVPTITIKGLADAGEGLVCVVENGIFDAAAICYSETEREAFADPADPRAKAWLAMPLATIFELCPRVKDRYES